MNDSNDYRAMERLLKELLPIDCPENIYTLPKWEAGEKFCAGISAVAWTGCACDVRLKPRLKELGLYRGAGFCTVIMRTDLFGQMMETERLGIVLHEFAHFLDFASIQPEVERRQEEFVGVPFKPDCDQPPEQKFYPWDGHGMTFTRIALHLRYRAAVASYDIPVSDLYIAGERYGMMPAQAYLIALGDEPRRLIDLPIVDIVKTDPPSEFKELFERDVARYFEPLIRAELMEQLRKDPTFIPSIAALTDSVMTPKNGD